MTAITREHREPGPSRRLSVALLVLGLALFVPSLVWGARAFSQFLTDDTFEGPGAIELDLSEGEHLVYQRVGIRIDDAELVGPGDVVVTELSTGAVIPDRIGGLGQSVTRGAVSYAGLVAFDIDRPGRYRVEVDSPVSTDFLVGRSIVDSFLDAWPALIGIIVGFIVAVTGLVMWIVGATRRRDRARRSTTGTPPMSPGPPPPPVSPGPPPAPPPAPGRPDAPPATPGSEPTPW